MKNVTWLSIASLLACHSYAAAKSTSLVDLLDVNPEVRITEKEKTRDCANFSGSWKGSCKVKDKTFDESVTIEQTGCELIEVTGSEGKKVKLPVGGVMNVSVTVPGKPGFTGSGTLTSNWNEERTVLQVIMGKSGKKLAVDRPSRGMMVSQQVKLVDGKLAVEFTAYYHKEKTTGACELVKM